jgi:CTP synthase
MVKCLNNDASLLTGLIAAASGQLEPLLRSCNMLNPSSTKPCTDGKVSSKLKLYPKGHLKNPLNSLVNGYYANGNGIPI